MSAEASTFTRFLATARAMPEAPAIWWHGRALSYGQCADTVSELVSWLGAEVGPAATLALSLPKGPDAILLMLACLGSNVPYVPIDPAAPGRRREQILEDCRPQLAVLPSRAEAEWLNASSVERVEPVPALASLTGEVLVARCREPAPSARTDLAYVLYTSGSTGVPKGVMITTANLDHFVGWSSTLLPVGPGDRVAVHAPLHFDLPVYDVFVSLASGACVYPLDEQTVVFPVATHRFLHEHAVTCVYAVPSAYVAMVNRSPLTDLGLPDLRQLLYAGEEFHVGPLRRLAESVPASTRIYNLYGPVETNVVTWYEVTDAVWGMPRVPIGQPAPDTRIQVVHEGRLTDEPGVDGELVVDGPSVSPGYLNDREKTAASRLGRSYRTGDIGCFDDQGDLWFLGRRDGMVKTRGFRVELGDVEAAILEHPSIAEAAVRPSPHPDAGTVLKAYVVPAAGADLTASAVQDWVAALRPSYMVPFSVEVREDFPRTSTGKIARTALTLSEPSP